MNLPTTERPERVDVGNAVMDNGGQAVGLLAAAGRFPLAVAEKARTLGRPVVCVAIRGLAPPELEPLVRRCYWTGIGRLGRAIRCFQREGVHDWMMAGKIEKTRYMNGRWGGWRHFPDWRFVRLWYRRLRDKRDDSLLSAIVAEFESEGLHCRSALDLCPELLVSKAVLTRRQPTAAEWQDIEFGWDLAKEMGRLDVGQTVAVRELAVLAVEAIEGTDRAIARAGELCPRGGFTVVKVAKPQQDMRFDVPTVGLTTVESLRNAGGRVLAIEADKTILLDAAQTVALADRYGLSIVAR
jgi:DUF1009 family protein